MGKRLFIAVKIAPQLLESYLDFLKIQCAGQAVRWVNVQQLHITLRFIGDTAEPMIPLLIHSLGELQKQTPAFNGYFTHLGVFGSSYQARIIWLGIEPLIPFQNLISEIEAKLFMAGIAKDRRPQVPHITLGRIIHWDQKAQLRKITEQNTCPIPAEFSVNEFYLIESILTSQGPIYRDLLRINLQSYI